MIILRQKEYASYASSLDRPNSKIVKTDTGYTEYITAPDGTKYEMYANEDGWLTGYKAYEYPKIRETIHQRQQKDQEFLEDHYGFERGTMSKWMNN